MYPSELEWLKLNIVNSKIDLLIECGRQDGASSRWFHENLPEHLEIFSIDLDDRPGILENSIRNLKDTRVQAVTGNIFEEVPRIIAENPSKRICVVEDAVKGWAGLGLLLAAANFENVIIIAEHNLHTGHRSRGFFQRISQKNIFLEFSDNADIRELHKRLVLENPAIAKNSNRDIEESSLGLINFDCEPRASVLKQARAQGKKFGLWAPQKIGRHWDAKNYQFYKKIFILEKYLRFLKKAR